MDVLGVVVEVVVELGLVGGRVPGCPELCPVVGDHEIHDLGVLCVTTSREEKMRETNPGTGESKLEVLEKRRRRAFGLGLANNVLLGEGVVEEGVDVGFERGNVNEQAVDPGGKSLVSTGDGGKAGRRRVRELGFAKELNRAEEVSEGPRLLGAGVGTTRLANLGGVESGLLEEEANFAGTESGEVGKAFPAFSEHFAKQGIDAPGGDTGVAVGVGAADLGHHDHRIVVRGTAKVAVADGGIAGDAGGDAGVGDDGDVGVDIQYGVVGLGEVGVDAVETGATGVGRIFGHEGVGRAGLENLDQGVPEKNFAPSREGRATEGAVFGVKGISLDVFNEVEVATEEGVNVRGLEEEGLELVELGEQTTSVAACREVEVEELEGAVVRGREGSEADNLDSALSGAGRGV